MKLRGGEGQNGRLKCQWAFLLARRMEQYEQTLRVMYQRITESRSHRHALGFNYEKLMVSHRKEIGKMIEGLYSGNDNVERATGTEGDLCSITVQTEVVTVNDSGRCSIRAAI